MPSLNRPPLPAGCALVRDVGLYLQSLVKHKNDPSSVAPTPPPQLGLELQIECELIAEVILTALQNARQTTWPLSDYLKASGGRKMTDSLPGVSTVKPDGELEVLDEPFCVMDSKELILAWYCPHILTRERQASIDKLTFAVEWLSKVPGLAMDGESESSFRSHPSLFGKDNSFRSGVITLASCWSMQGHPNGPFSPSANFKRPNQPVLPFLKMISESLAILGGILSIIHPAMFECGLDVLANLNAGQIKDVQDVDILRKVLESWSSPFTAFSLIINRETPVHKDGLSPPFSYDLLYTGGFYEDARLEVRGIGLRVRYVPGTVKKQISDSMAGLSKLNEQQKVRCRELRREQTSTSVNLRFALYDVENLIEGIERLAELSCESDAGDELRQELLPGADKLKQALEMLIEGNRRCRGLLRELEKGR
ncbi:hypothetical protein CC1G_14021 [Coprinopsis cinerea okayama7|uniref:2OGFeDO JBP1/TET oxygenase domain-containing protein n=1 Tax=Coprinopsis cinerea (strain Okayama-7 / 130 / ATCC MYA-4618 / FGSC 9003) TaxID=240176 RepID=D6RL11_COPC7|nr:hypothetical protein CC1G_14021 [Coprinopsis cinerea okayama7\|eukprot:XP_002911983.1 hypothetical protein CC1G_14021 [Coprinopsis cinerea okayama7\